MSDNADFFPIITSIDDDSNMEGEATPNSLPILPIRNNVLFPSVVIPITIGREKSIKLIKHYYKSSKVIGVATQKDSNINDPQAKHLFDIGIRAKIVKTLQMPDGNMTAIIQGQERIRIDSVVQEDPYIIAHVSPIKQEGYKENDQFKALMDSIKSIAIQIIQLSPHLPNEAEFAIHNIENPLFFVNFVSSNLVAEIETKQKLLEINDIKQKSELLLKELGKELNQLELQNQIQSKVKNELDKQQRDFLLNQQLKQIQQELGGNTPDLEIENLRKRAKEKKWTEETNDHFNKELDKLSRMNPSAADYSVHINYLELLLDLPWQDYSEDNLDIKHAQKVLDKDHFGLEKVKERIIQYLAVLKLKNNMKSPILCLVGPPGVGKTSLGRSIANALQRKYVRMALGGIHDEAEIRGHRKTYIGAMPGRIIQSIKKAKTSNPVFILDEIDKVGRDFRGDPSSALLEVLDPEQNNSFYDHYLEVDYDLSRVMFIATANTLSTIQPPLLDRMEIIEVNGYTIEEKIQIAEKFLIPKQIENHGIKKEDIAIKRKTLESIIDSYTRESGVRNLEKKIGTVVRNIAKSIAMEEEYDKKIEVDYLQPFLGVPIFDRDEYESNNIAGVVTGLAWTQVGGDILFIEVGLSPGTGKLKLTGNLGDVMKESASIALTFVKANATALDLNADMFTKWDIHIHVPAGAVPKDGPSAGIAMLTAITSALTQRKVKKRLAMTGEITLRGKVLPVGGIKEKILAAKRSKIKEILLPENNEKDISEIKSSYLKGLTINYVSDMNDVIDRALLQQKAAHAIHFNQIQDSNPKAVH